MSESETESGTVVLDRELSISPFSNVCTYCKHNFKDRIRSCSAFATIPLPIWNGDDDHRKPYPGDHGIRFEPVETKRKSPEK